MKIKIINNSCFLLELNNITILVDPYVNMKTLKSLKYDYVLISHAHLDHMTHLNKINVPVIGPKEICLKKDDIPISDTLKLGNVTINTTKTIHPLWFQRGFMYNYIQSFIASKRFIICKNSYGYIIEYDNEVLYYSGDTLYSKMIFQEIKNKYNPNICLIAFEEYPIPTMTLLSPLSKFKEIEEIFKISIIPIHQSRNWYLKNLAKYILINENISMHNKNI